VKTGRRKDPLLLQPDTVTERNKDDEEFLVQLLLNRLNRTLGPDCRKVTPEKRDADQGLKKISLKGKKKWSRDFKSEGERVSP